MSDNGVVCKDELSTLVEICAIKALERQGLEVKVIDANFLLVTGPKIMLDIVKEMN